MSRKANCRDNAMMESFFATFKKERIVTFGFVFVQGFRKKIPLAVALPFAVNLVANLVFTPIQFGMRSLPLAAVDIVIVWATIIDDRGDLEAPQMGCCGSGALFHMGVDCDRAATVNYVE